MDTPVTLSREQKKILFLSSLGGVLEYYDFVVYIFLTNILEKLFFPSSSEFISTLKTLTVFSIGYFFRPLGGLIFSHFGDRHGRKTVFLLTIVLMAFPSFAIALLPTALQMGGLATLLLIVFRIMQGLAVGGEIPAAITFVSEHVDRKHCAFATATLFFGINIGLLLGSAITGIMTWLLPTDALYAYGWRIPFFIGGVFGLISIYLRSYLRETTSFTRLDKHSIQRIPVITLFKQYLPQVVHSFVLVSLAAVTIFLYLYLPHYLNQYMGVPLSTAFKINTFGTLILSISIVGGGLLADRFGYQKIYAIGAALLVLLSFPLFLMFATNSTLFIVLSYVIFSMIFGLITGSYPAILSVSFPTFVRYTGIAISYNLAFAIFGGLSPIICTLAIYYLQTTQAPAYYMMLAAIIPLCMLLLISFRRDI